MTNDAAIREQLHACIEHGDEKLISILYAVVNAYEPIDEETLAELERRTALRESGQSKTYSWEEAKKFITAK